MNRRGRPGQVAVQAVHVERRDGSSQDGHFHQNLVKGLVGGILVGPFLATPVALAVQADIPVAHLVAHKVLDQPAGRGDIVILIGGEHLGHERIQFGKRPAVDFGTLRHRNGGSGRIESVHIGILGE